MKYFLIFILSFVFNFSDLKAQPIYTAANVHAHNDYVQPIPFYTAYYQQAGSIEADLFLLHNQLYVAHEPQEIAPDRTLEVLYLNPLKTLIKKNNGHPYQQPNAQLQFLIDLKTEGTSTLALLIKKLASYPEITDNQNIQIVISGNRPAPETWASYPPFIYFDGRPNETYPAAAMQKVGLISDSFRNYTQWNGKGLIVKNDQEKLAAIVTRTHQQQKKLRLWATPDNITTWKALMQLEVDYLGTDDVIGLTTFLKKLPANEFKNSIPHPIYTPKNKNTDSRKKVKNVILLIGDGMGLAQIYAGYSAAAGQINLFNFLNIGLSKTSAADTYITDSAAGATAMATGEKTNNRYIGVNTKGKPLETIPEIINKFGMKSGIISSGDITDATPASFYAHQPERSMSEAIAADFLKSPVSILIGGNSKAFNRRKDKVNLLQQLNQKGYSTATNLSVLDTINQPKFVVLDSVAQLSAAKGRGEFLIKAFRKTVNTLQKNKKGFFIMAEGAQIDHGGHQNNLPFAVQEMLDFDKLVGEALKFADEDGETLVLVTADHETGGLSLIDGNIKQGYVASNFSTDDHSAIPVPVFAYGPHSLDFRGVYENTELFNKIMQVIRKYHK